MIEFVVKGKAEPGGSKIAGRSKGGRLYVRDDNRNVEEWKRRVADAAATQVDHLLEGPLRLHVRFVVQRPKSQLGTGRNAGAVKRSAPPFPVTRPDATKLVRAVEDALKNVVFYDDSQIVQQAVSKVYARPGEGPRCEVAVEPVPFFQARAALRSGSPGSEVRSAQIPLLTQRSTSAP